MADDAYLFLLPERHPRLDCQALVYRAMTSGVPAARIVRLTGLDPQEIAHLTV